MPTLKNMPAALKSDMEDLVNEAWPLVAHYRELLEKYYMGYAGPTPGSFAVEDVPKIKEWFEKVMIVGNRPI